MAAPNPKKFRRWVSWLWGINILIAVVLVAFWFRDGPTTLAFFKASTPAPINTPAFTVSFTFTRSLTFTSTETPLPSTTFTPSLTSTETQTPIPFSEGPIKIGESVQGRPMEVYRFGSGPVERLIVAGMHGGNEYNTVQLVDELMAYITDHPEIIPAQVSLYFLHALNPDGIARALNYLGRPNANGVDLNRNWPVNWKKDWDRDGCWITTYVTGGKAPASEPEVKALMAFIEDHHFDGLINYHSAALGVFAGGVPPTDASIQLAQAIADISTYKYPPVDTGCEYTGGMVDWTADDENIPSVDLELTNHADTDFDMNLGILQMFLSWKAK
jgi:hypothetical protein